jgi:uncharacterized coiled-coil DUF342 family protein
VKSQRAALKEERDGWHAHYLNVCEQYKHIKSELNEKLSEVETLHDKIADRDGANPQNWAPKLGRIS